MCSLEAVVTLRTFELVVCVKKVIQYMALFENPDNMIQYSDIKKYIEAKKNITQNKRLLDERVFDENLMTILWRLEPFSFGMTNIVNVFRHPILEMVDLTKSTQVEFECFSDGFRKIEILIKSKKYDEFFMKYMIESIQHHCLQNIPTLHFCEIPNPFTPVSASMVCTAIENIYTLTDDLLLVLNTIGISLFQKTTFPNYFWFLAGIGYSHTPNGGSVLMVNHFNVHALIMKLSIASQNFDYGVYVLIRLRIFITSQEKSSRIFCFDDYVEFITKFTNFVNYCSKNSNALMILSSWYVDSLREMVGMRDFDVILGIQREKYLYDESNDIFQQMAWYDNFTTQHPDFDFSKIPIFDRYHKHFNFFLNSFVHDLKFDVCETALFNPVEFVCVLLELLKPEHAVQFIQHPHNHFITTFLYSIEYNEYKLKSYCGEKHDTLYDKVPKSTNHSQSFSVQLKEPCNVIDVSDNKVLYFNDEYYILWNEIFKNQPYFKDLLLRIIKPESDEAQFELNEINILCFPGKYLIFRQIDLTNFKSDFINFQQITNYQGLQENILSKHKSLIILNLKREFFEMIQLLDISNVQNPDFLEQNLYLLKTSNFILFTRIMSDFCMRKISFLSTAPEIANVEFDRPIKSTILKLGMKATQNQFGDVQQRSFFVVQNINDGMLKVVVMQN